MTSCELLFNRRTSQVMSAKVVMNPNAKEAKCFGLVTMSQESEAETAIQKLNGYKLHNKEIVTSRVSHNLNLLFYNVYSCVNRFYEK